MAYDKSTSLAAFCYQNGYTDTIQIITIDVDGNPITEVIPNPESMEDFKSRKFKEFYEQSVIAWERSNASKVASDAKEEEVKAADVASDIKLEEKIV